MDSCMDSYNACVGDSVPCAKFRALRMSNDKLATECGGR